MHVNSLQSPHEISELVQTIATCLFFSGFLRRGGSQTCNRPVDLDAFDILPPEWSVSSPDERFVVLGIRVWLGVASTKETRPESSARCDTGHTLNATAHATSAASSLQALHLSSQNRPDTLVGCRASLFRDFRRRQRR